MLVAFEGGQLGAGKLRDRGNDGDEIVHVVLIAGQIDPCAGVRLDNPVSILSNCKFKCRFGGENQTVSLKIGRQSAWIPSKLLLEDRNSVQQLVRFTRCGERCARSHHNPDRREQLSCKLEAGINVLLAQCSPLIFAGLIRLTRYGSSNFVNDAFRWPFGSKHFENVIASSTHHAA